MDRKGFGIGVGLALTVAVGLPAWAEKVYRWVDPQGNIVYQDKPPPGGVGKVEIKEIDPKATTTQFKRPNVAQPKAAGGDDDAASSPTTPDQRAQRARQRALIGSQADEPVNPETPKEGGTPGSGVPIANTAPLSPTPSAASPAVPTPAALAPPPSPPPPPPPVPPAPPAAGAF